MKKRSIYTNAWDARYYSTVTLGMITRMPVVEKEIENFKCQCGNVTASHNLILFPMFHPRSVTVETALVIHKYLWLK